MAGRTMDRYFLTVGGYFMGRKNKKVSLAVCEHMIGEGGHTKDKAQIIVNGTITIDIEG
jgi:hypothetical protein